MNSAVLVLVIAAAVAVLADARHLDALLRGELAAPTQDASWQNAHVEVKPHSGPQSWDFRADDSLRKQPVPTFQQRVWGGRPVPTLAPSPPPQEQLHLQAPGAGLAPGVSKGACSPGLLTGAHTYVLTGQACTEALSCSNAFSQVHQRRTDTPVVCGTSSTLSPLGLQANTKWQLSNTWAGGHVGSGYSAQLGANHEGPHLLRCAVSTSSGSSVVDVTRCW